MRCPALLLAVLLPAIPAHAEPLPFEASLLLGGGVALPASSQVGSPRAFGVLALESGVRPHPAWTLGLRAEAGLLDASGASPFPPPETLVTSLLLVSSLELPRLGPAWPSVGAGFGGHRFAGVSDWRSQVELAARFQLSTWFHGRFVLGAWRSGATQVAPYWLMGASF